MMTNQDSGTQNGPPDAKKGLCHQIGFQLRKGLPEAKYGLWHQNALQILKGLPKGKNGLWNQNGIQLLERAFRRNWDTQNKIAYTDIHLSSAFLRLLNGSSQLGWFCYS